MVKSLANSKAAPTAVQTVAAEVLQACAARAAVPARARGALVDGAPASRAAAAGGPRATDPPHEALDSPSAVVPAMCLQEVSSKILRHLSVVIRPISK